MTTGRGLASVVCMHSCIGLLLASWSPTGSAAPLPADAGAAGGPVGLMGSPLSAEAPRPGAPPAEVHATLLASAEGVQRVLLSALCGDGEIGVPTGDDAERVGREECIALLQTVFRVGDVLSPGLAEGRSWAVRLTDGGVPLRTGATCFAFRAVLRTEEGSGLHCEGRLGVAFDRHAVGLVARVMEPLAPADLARSGGSSAVRWPEGMAGMGAVSLVTDGPGGARWSHTPLPGRTRGLASEVLDWRLASSWPMQVRAWSDGEWWAVVVSTTCPGDSLGTTGVARALAGFASTLTMDRATELEAGVPHRCPRIEFRVAEPGDAPAYWALATRRRPAEADSPMRAGVDDPSAWTHGQAAPAIVHQYLGGAALPPSLGASEPNDGVMTGMYRLDRTESGLGFVWWPPVPAVVLWELGPRRLSIIQAAVGQGDEDIDRTLPDAAVRAVLVDTLPALLGEYGRRLTLVPVDVRQVEGTDWWCVTPDPDHEVGLLERVRVGDTPWGKCRIYVDPAILHIVFDLPEEEGPAE